MKIKKFLEYYKKIHIYIIKDKNKGDFFMKFFKKHKLFSFAVISFLILTGANFFMIYELLTIGVRILVM